MPATCAAERPSPASGGSKIRSWKPDSSRRSEEHTSELQSQSNLVCRLLLEKKKTGIFVFNVSSSLTANVNSVIAVTSNPCNIYWRVGSSSTLNGENFRVTVIANASITDWAGIFVFNVASSLTANVNSVIAGTAKPCNIYWRVGSSAPLNGVNFRGIVIANASITFGSDSFFF